MCINRNETRRTLEALRSRNIGIIPLSSGLCKSPKVSVGERLRFVPRGLMSGGRDEVGLALAIESLVMCQLITRGNTRSAKANIILIRSLTTIHSWERKARQVKFDDIPELRSAGFSVPVPAPSWTPEYMAECLLSRLDDTKFPS